MEDTVFAARQIETLIYGDYGKNITIHLFTDSEGTLKSIVSMKQVERKSLHMVIQDLKERLVDIEILSYQWIPTGLMWADTLTKEMEMYCDMRELLTYGNLDLKNEVINRVQCIY